jgi:hypothetical protein
MGTRAESARSETARSSDAIERPRSTGDPGERARLRHSFALEIAVAVMHHEALAAGAGNRRYQLCAGGAARRQRATHADAQKRSPQVGVHNRIREAGAACARLKCAEAVEQVKRVPRRSSSSVVRQVSYLWRRSDASIGRQHISRRESRGERERGGRDFPGGQSLPILEGRFF